MLPIFHFIIAFIISIILLLLKWQWWQIALFILAAVFIDLDHYFLYINRKKDFNLKRAYKYFLGYRRKKEILLVFHTIEVFVLLIILTILSFSYFFPLLLGFIVHCLFDLLYNITVKEKRYKRALSLILYLARK